MNIEAIRDYCITKEAVEESFPFDESTLVFKVGNKIFALINVDKFEFINLKCDPEKAIELREIHEYIRPGYHMNKKHWNSVYLLENPNEKIVYQLIDHSYEIIKKNLPKKTKQALGFISS